MNFGDMRVLLDLTILALLIGTILHSTILNRNLKRLREGRAELDGLVQNLSDSVMRAEAAIEGLKRSAAESGVELQKQTETARVLADELHIMNEAGNNLAQRLERTARAGRNTLEDDLPPPTVAPSSIRALRPERTAVAPRSAAAEVSPRAAGEARPKMASQAERELMAAIEIARRGTA